MCSQTRRTRQNHDRTKAAFVGGRMLCRKRALKINVLERKGQKATREAETGTNRCLRDNKSVRKSKESHYMQ